MQEKTLWPAPLWCWVVLGWLVGLSGVGFVEHATRGASEEVQGVSVRPYARAAPTFGLGPDLGEGVRELDVRLDLAAKMEHGGLTPVVVRRSDGVRAMWPVVDATWDFDRMSMRQWSALDEVGTTRGQAIVEARWQAERTRPAVPAVGEVGGRPEWGFDIESVRGIGPTIRRRAALHAAKMRVAGLGDSAVPIALVPAEGVR